MSAEPKAVIRCAIYTRKSSEEGLEQSFNSLDAQREACLAFVVSQRHEGWRPLSARYDDGGYSGATLVRPALQRLMDDVENNNIDTIVVYKVDRLTRSLADFAKIVEALDARKVSFVSVTQQFNTTSSMGRLTLNVLLSFAQFEREVTGERIRDKIAASKRKGMWMGGNVPLGYDLKDRKLIVNPEEAKLVGSFFSLYLDLGCVSGLKAKLDREGIKSKVRISAGGNKSGGHSFSRGALYQILKNRIYLGEIPHRGVSHPGEHKAIVPLALWKKVQAQLRSDNQGRRNGVRAHSPSLLTGLLEDAEGRCFTPSHTVKNGKRYRYYVSRGAINGLGPQMKSIRLPAHDIEEAVSFRLQSFLRSTREVLDRLSLPEDSPAVIEKLSSAAMKRSEQWATDSSAAVQYFVRRAVRRVVVRMDKIEVEASKRELRETIIDSQFATSGKRHRVRTDEHSDDLIRFDFATRLARCGCEMRLLVPPDSHEIETRVVTPLVKAIARAHDWCEQLVTGKASTLRSIAEKTGLNERYVRRVLECAFLAPDIIGAILDGVQPPDLTFERITRRVPLNWVEQRHQLGFPAAKMARKL